VSLTLHRDLLYVLNAGGQAGSADNLAGFRIQRFGQLDPIAGSVHPLSAPSTGPAEISFSPEGDFLVVTEKTENKILTFPVDEEGVAGPAVENPSAGTTPFGFAFDREGDLLVSEALGGAADASALSSYQLGDDGGLTVHDPSVPTKETAACWVVATHDGRFAYVTNTGSGTISGFSIDENGQLALLNAADGITATTGPAPIDAALARGSRFLFELETGAIRGFEIARDGALRQVSTLEGLPPAANGLAAR
jgi:6-phosphogluconolactonase (cycloisomerase 2 family)